ncbi:hypothetical protein H9P43_007834 [Blastocladiella emersonii ATCC 22665]|nr:hypothetical protein H9P43_007834 [Blastocladiella emersonii ATCC 22665]
MFGQQPRPKLSDRQFRWLTVIVSIPIFIVSSKILIERTFFGAQQRPRGPRIEDIVDKKV